LKNALLAAVRTEKSTLYGLAIAQAQRIDVSDEAITFTFAANQGVARMQLEQNREWLETLAERLAGRPLPVHTVQAEGETPVPPGSAGPEGGSATPASPGRDLRAEALASSAVQAMLDVFPAEVGDVEEM